MDLSSAATEFLQERHLATLTTRRPDGTAHVTPVGFTWDAAAGVLRIITDGASRKARNAATGGLAAVCQFDGGRWLTLEGTVRVLTGSDEVAEAERRYAERYRTPRANPTRVVLEITVTRTYGSRTLVE